MVWLALPLRFADVAASLRRNAASLCSSDLRCQKSWVRIPVGAQIFRSAVLRVVAVVFNLCGGGRLSLIHSAGVQTPVTA